MLIILRRNNFYTHVEGIFLASTKVDYLGHTITNKGIQPQISKILPILQLDRPKNRRQLRSFLGFVDYYKKICYQWFLILEPLTRISSDNTKFKWTEVKQKSFKEMKNMMAKKNLQHYPDFNLDFDVYTDASDSSKELTNRF